MRGCAFCDVKHEKFEVAKGIIGKVMRIKITEQGEVAKHTKWSSLEIRYCPMCGKKLSKKVDYKRITIVKLDLSPRAYYMLKRNEIHYVSQIIDSTFEELLAIKSMGEQTAQEIYNKLEIFKRSGERQPL